MKSKKSKKKLASNPFKIQLPFYISGVVFIVFLLLILIAGYFYTKNEQLLGQKNSFIQSNTINYAKTNQPTPKKTSQLSKPSPQITPVYQPVVSGFSERVPILYYHYVGNNPNPADKARDSLSISPEKFEEEMKYLKDNGYQTTSLDTLASSLQTKSALPPKTVILTFDDGYSDFYYNAYPILRKYNYSATVFIITGFVGGGSYLNWDQIKEMHSSGLISFGAHTVHHYHLTSVSQPILQSELSESKNVLQAQLGVPINFIAYPYGSTNDNVIQATKNAGFVGAVGTWPQKTQSEGTIYNMPRMRVSGLSGLGYFIQLL